MKAIVIEIFLISIFFIQIPSVLSDENSLLSDLKRYISEMEKYELETEFKESALSDDTFMRGGHSPTLTNAFEENISAILSNKEFIQSKEFSEYFEYFCLNEKNLPVLVFVSGWVSGKKDVTKVHMIFFNSLAKRLKAAKTPEMWRYIYVIEQYLHFLEYSPELDKFITTYLIDLISATSLLETQKSQQEKAKFLFQVYFLFDSYLSFRNRPFMPPPRNPFAR